jgi:hypothetical protein
MHSEFAIQGTRLYIAAPEAGGMYQIAEASDIEWAEKILVALQKGETND